MHALSDKFHVNSRWQFTSDCSDVPNSFIVLFYGRDLVQFAT
jgi:hypothetical protein